MWDEIVAFTLKYMHCPYCKAWPGQRCKTATGHKTSHLHSQRTLPVQGLWMSAYRDGDRDGKWMAENAHRAS